MGFGTLNVHIACVHEIYRSDFEMSFLWVIVIIRADALEILSHSTRVTVLYCTVLFTFQPTNPPTPPSVADIFSEQPLSEKESQLTRFF